ncbi:MAG: hypothetical protein MUF31_09485 [Akkermansiaceae bacterium]|nr:hypothetical protein [Akkermansiaceae bacterium]
MKTVLAPVLLCLGVFHLSATAAPILTPSTTTYGGIVDGNNFVTGSGTSSQFSGNRWPFGQDATKAVDGLIGPGSKYLNLNVTTTALIFSGTTARVPSRLELWVAEDAVERDPTSYILYGTNVAIPALTSGGTFALGNFTQIASGTLDLPDLRDTTSDSLGYSQSVPIPGSTAYASYLLVFPTVKNAPTAANSMQISEVQLHANGINVVESSDFSNDGPGPSISLEPGINRISGTLLSPSDLQDRFSVIVPAGTRLLSVNNTNAFNSGVPITFPVSAGTYPVLFSTNFTSEPAPWSLTLTVEALPSTLPIIGVESFDYPDGPIDTKSGGTFWDYKNIAPTAHTGTASAWENVTAAPAIASGRLVTHNSSAKRTYNGASQADGAVNDPASVPSSAAKSVYYRVTVTTGATVPTEFGLSSYDFGTEKIFFGKRAASSLFVVEETGVGQSGAATTVLPNTTYTLVARVDYAANIVRLYLNPDLNAPESTQPPAVTRTYTGTNWSTAVRLASSGGSPVVWDNLVVATAWDVLGTVVTTPVDELNPSLQAGGNGVSLREAVKYAPEGGLITFAPGLNSQTCTLSTGTEIVVTKSVNLDASSLSSGLTIDGGTGTNRLFSVNSGQSLTLRGLTLTGGNGTGAAGNNNGGAIFNSGTLTLTQCTLSGNSASFGGAIRNFGGTLMLTQCTLSGNSASAEGGAISSGGTLSLMQCTLSGNSANLGGAILINIGGTPMLTQCTLSGNSAINVGGAIYNGGTMTLAQCTLSGNSAAIIGGGAVHTNLGSSLTLTNTIVAGNTAPVGPDVSNNAGTITSNGTNLVGNNSSVDTQLPATPGLIGTAAAPVNARLSPLGYFGGPVQTMHPLIGSPAIDAAGSLNPGGTDARGFPRFRDGDDSGNPQLDIGAVEAGETYRVDSVSDPGGLRSILALAYLGNNPGIRIIFNPAIFSISSPPVITLNGNELTTPAGETIFIDASNIPGGVTLSGNHTSRVFNIASGATVAMHSVRIVNGKAANGADGPLFGIGGNDGGGIVNAGNLSLFSCMLSGNSTGNGGLGDIKGGGGGNGGGIFNSGSLSLTACAITGNATGNGRFSPGAGGDGGSGGGIFSSGSLSLTACTLSGNAAGNGGNADSGGDGGSGGGIRQEGAISCRLTACTIVGNQTGIGGTGSVNGASGTGGGISGGNAILENCLIGQNTQGPSTPDDVSVTTITYVGGNLLSTAATGTATGSPTINPNPLLAPLGDYGGPTQTRPPLPGSPAINAAIGSNRLTDQRGFPIVGTADIGAAEYQGPTDLRLYWESDWDGDGNAFGIEHALGTNPALSDPANSRNLSGPTFTPVGQASLTFGRNTSAAPGTISILKRSTDLITFSEVFRITGNSPVPGLGISAIILPDSITILDSNPPPGKAFYRIEAVSP